MKATINSYDCVDHDPIDQWVPNDPYDVDIWVNFRIGPDTESGDNFQVHIVTPNNLHGKGSTKYAIILYEYSWKKVLRTVESMLEQCQCTSWIGISRQLANLMHWEYENYKP
ncbi:Imm8 family immunity protein [Microbulbifer sp. CNSA002]|uniref:Imm8 family immunity protein n=1 Tax=unclassified Microbulbifer TaxID=2619833 RepID=UPI0039B3D62F